MILNELTDVNDLNLIIKYFFDVVTLIRWEKRLSLQWGSIKKLELEQRICMQMKKYDL